MKNIASGLWLVGLLAVVGCGGDDDDDKGGTATPEAACKSIVAGLCSKLYSCFSETELDLVRSGSIDTVGSDEADCRKRNEQEQCREAVAECEGKTFSSSKANECLSGLKASSCDDFKSDAGNLEACDSVCE